MRLQVKNWVNKAAHFGNTTTSRNESSHAAIKAYLTNSRGDHKAFFEAVCIFWKDQHRLIREAIDQEKVLPKHAYRTAFFGDVINFVHGYALQKIVDEKGKIPLRGPPTNISCACWIQSAFGLPCYHQIYQKQQNPGRLSLADINPHWYYDRGVVPPQNTRRILLDPLVVKGKGRPKGSKGKGKNMGESSTRRDPSLFEHEAIELPSSTAPATLETVRQPMLSTSPIREATTMQIQREVRPKWDTGENSFMANLTTTALGILRGAGSDEDPYEAGTLRERAYLRSLHPNKLAEQIDEDKLDKDNGIQGDENYENDEDDENDFVGIGEFINKGNFQGHSTSPPPSPALQLGGARRQFELPFSPPKKRQVAGINESQLTDRDAEGETDWEF